jgi:hypothetical protein
MSDFVINDSIVVTPPAIEAPSAHYASVFEEITTILEDLIDKIDKTTQDIDAILAA